MTAHITQILYRAAQLHGDSPALEFQSVSRTWQETLSRVQHFAGGLKHIGVEANQQVAILALNSAAYFECLFSVPALGARIVPLNVRWAAAEIDFAIKDSESQTLIFDRAFLPVVETLRHSCAAVTRYVFIDDGGDCPVWALSMEGLLSSSKPYLDLANNDNDLAGIFYTGGTTGFPKGVMLQHAALMSSALCVVAAVEANSTSVALHAAPMFHLADLTSCFAYTMLGAKHVIVPMFEPQSVASCLTQHAITDLLLVPTMIQLLMDSPAFQEHGFAQVNNLLYGASPMPEGLLVKVLEGHPNVSLIQAFGQTEMAPVISLLVGSDHSLTENKKYLLRSAGRAVPSVSIEIKAEDGTLLDAGQVGEVCARGPSVMAGYWRNPSVTAETIVNGWLHTGDAGYIDDDGYLFIVDRIKDMIVTGGENVYSAEVENVLSTMPGIQQVAVIGVPDSQWGERVHAVVMLAQSKNYTSTDLIEHCKQHIATYKCPKSIQFTAEPLPLSGAGKVLKRELRDAYIASEASSRERDLSKCE
ncbi:long-chain-fatty-acid--CoA ligase [Zhongshania aliphaticivorans]|uniref:long-chain-fatty-acid--CoA ligase n=1 Tax=Zhongshania aliphaticivorans TaxID=1470434 RepID=UPI0009EE145A|nr:long-chain-fatty-acid--CoA ligase [Zhongshania aliphaticivorans]